MWNFRDIIKTTISIEAIYRCRKTPLIISLFFFIMINVGFAFPFVFGVVKLDQINVTNYIPIEAVTDFEEDPTTDFLRSYHVQDGELMGNSPEGITTINIDSYSMLVDLEDTMSQEKINKGSENEQEVPAYSARVTKDYIEINIGVQIVSTYDNFEVISLENKTKTEILNYFLINTLRSSLKQWVIPLFMFFYLVFLLMNTVFVGGMSLLAMLFRVGDRIKLSYKETLNVVIYSSVIPTVIAAITSIFLNMLGVNLLIYNFGTFLVYMIVRKKFLKNPKMPMGAM